MSYQSHQQAGHAINAACAVITLSDTRTPETDRSGPTIQQLLQSAGHTIAQYHLIPDDPALLEPLLNQLLHDPSIDCIITNGGTGISPRDQTIDIISRHITLPLPGFGELFRMLSFEQIQSGAMLSRAHGGIAHHKPLFALPGSTNAVELALTRLILPELRHLLAELEK